MLDAYGTDVDQKRMDTQLHTQVKAIVGEIPGVDKGQWAQLSLLKTVERALALLVLSMVVVDTVSRQHPLSQKRKKLAASVEIREKSRDNKALGEISLADAVRVYVPGDGDQRYVRADEFAKTMRRAMNQRRMQRRDRGIPSDSEYESPDRPTLPTPMDVAPAPPPFDPLRRWEAVDSRALMVTLADALADEAPRDVAIAAIDARIDTLNGQIATPAITTELQQLEGWRKPLYKMADMEAMLTATDGHFGEEETQMKRWLQVPYEKAPLGRTYARAPVVEMRLFDGADDPAQKQKARPLGYPGMHSELRAVLGGRFLHDIDKKKAFANLVVNIARRKGWLHLIPQIADYAANGDAFLQRIVDYHNLTLTMDADAAKGAAKQLVNGKMNGLGYGTWLKEHRLPIGGGEPHVVALGLEVDAFRERVFADPEFKPRVDQERDALHRDRPSEGPARIERSLWARWLQEHENTVLMLIDAKLRRMDCTVMALVFDGCMVEAPEGVNIESVLREIEAWLREEHDWRILLDEKPLHGLQDTPPPSFVAARAALAAVQAALGT